MDERSKKPFSLRAWQYCCNDSKRYLEHTIDRVICEAKKYDITHMEFGVNILRNSNVYTTLPVGPCGNWVLCGLDFKHFPRLAPP